MPDGRTMSPDAPGSRFERWMPLIPPAAALAIFFIYLGQIAGQPFFKYLVANPLVYDSEARRLLGGEPLGEPFFLSALYPAFVALVYRFSGASRLALAVTQGIVMAAGVWLVGEISRRLFSARTAFIAGLVTVFYWSFYYFAGEMVPATMFVGLLLAGAVVFIDAVDGRRTTSGRGAAIGAACLGVAACFAYALPGLTHLADVLWGGGLPQPASHYAAGIVLFLVVAGGAVVVLAGDRFSSRLAASRDFLASGLIWGLATLAWSGAAVVAAPAALWLAVSRATRLKAWALVAGFVIPIAGSTAYNLLSSGQLVPVTTSFGVNLFIGANPASDGLDPFKLGEGNRVRIEADRLGLWGKRRSDFFTDQALKFIGSHPARWLSLEGKKLVVWVSRFQINNNADIAERRSAWKHFFLPWLNFGVVFPLAAAGAVFAAKQNRRALMLAVGYAGFLAIPLVFFTCERFRLPAIALAIPLAAYGAEEIVRSVASRTRRHLAGALAALAIAAALSNVDFFRLSTYEMPAIVTNKAYVARLAGDRQEARTLALRALELDPHSAGALFQLGALAQDDRRWLEAFTYYLQCLEADPYFAAAYEGAGAILGALGINRSYLDAYVQDVLSGGDYARARTALIDFVRNRAP